MVNIITVSQPPPPPPLTRDDEPRRPGGKQKGMRSGRDPKRTNAAPGNAARRGRHSRPGNSVCAVRQGVPGKLRRCTNQQETIKTQSVKISCFNVRALVFSFQAALRNSRGADFRPADGAFSRWTWWPGARLSRPYQTPSRSASRTVLNSTNACTRKRTHSTQVRPVGFFSPRGTNRHLVEERQEVFDGLDFVQGVSELAGLLGGDVPDEDDPLPVVLHILQRTPKSKEATHGSEPRGGVTGRGRTAPCVSYSRSTSAPSVTYRIQATRGGKGHRSQVWKHDEPEKKAPGLI